MNYRLQDECFTPQSQRKAEWRTTSEGSDQLGRISQEPSSDYQDERAVMALALHMELRQLAAETASLHRRLADVYPELIRFQSL